MRIRRVLLVDDDQNSLVLAMRAFKKWCAPLASLAVAKSVREAQEVLAVTSTPDLVILDVHMPDQDGFELLKFLKKDDRLRFAPVVMLSASDADDDIKQAFALGCNSYILKPTDYEEFQERIGLLFRYWLQNECLTNRVERAMQAETALLLD